MRKQWRLLVDALALVVLAGYGWAIQHTRAGAADPTWTAITRRGVLRVGSAPGFRPFAEEQNGSWSGYDIDLATTIARRLGLRVAFKAVGYDALYDALAAGDVDLLASALPLAPEQGWRARFSTAYFDAGQVLVVRADSDIRRLDDLAGRRAGAALGSEGDTLLRGLRRRIPNVIIQSEYETPAAVLQALQRGALDAVVVDTASALGLTESDRRFTIVTPGLSFEPYVLAMPAGAYQLQAQVNAILDELRREKYFEQLNTRWFGIGVPKS